MKKWIQKLIIMFRILYEYIDFATDIYLIPEISDVQLNIRKKR